MGRPLWDFLATCTDWTPGRGRQSVAQTGLNPDFGCFQPSRLVWVVAFLPAVYFESFIRTRFSSSPLRA